jgi:hypothetical protein
MLKKPEESSTGILVQVIEDCEEISTHKLTPNRKYLYKLMLLLLKLDIRYVLTKKQYEKIKTILLYTENED